ncbi:MAG TPA: glycosyltransferase family 4 protein [Chloroflexota bacterium]|nr:glycosyltransferase family 4 protein [Chloroflexota bacterium]
MSEHILLVQEAGYPWAIGGVTTWINDLLFGLPELEITVLGLRWGSDPRPAPLLPPGKRFVDVGFDWGLDVDTAVERSLNAIRSLRPSVVHASSSGIAGWVAAAAAREMDIPLVVTEHGIAWMQHAPQPGQGGDHAPQPAQPGHGGDHGPEPAQPGRGAEQAPQPAQPGHDGGGRPHGPGGGGGHPSMLWWTPGERQRAAAIYAQADAITSVSWANARLQECLVPAAKPILVIPNGVEPAEARPPAEPLVVFAGRIAPEKGVDLFIRTAALLARAPADVRFEVRGPANEPDYAKECAALAAELGLAHRLRFTGPLPRAAVLDGASLLVAPSRIEACPYAVLEALAAGVPVVAAPAGDVPMILAGCGAISEAHPAALANASERLLEERETASRASLARARSFGKAAMLEAYRALYKEVEGRKRRSRAA